MENPLIEKLGGNFKKDPQQVQLSEEARQLVAAAFEDIPEGQVWDYHLHIAGVGAGGTGCWINPEVFSWLHPKDKLKANLFMSAAGIEDMRKADQQYVDRLLTLTKDFPRHSMFCILAIDRCYNKDGSLNEKDSKWYIPNEYVFSLCQAHPDVFVPCISVHPYRKDALDELDKYGRMGVKMLKWMPAIMGMDASDVMCVPFYEKMKEYDMVLLTHTGQEDTLYTTKFMPLNNPLLWRRPLDMGLKIIMAHCAGKGSSPDFEHPENAPEKNHKLFIRLMEDKRYNDTLFGDIAAVTESHRCGEPLLEILKRKDLHHRLINGSDYPLPGINAVISTDQLEKLGYITAEEKEPLREIYQKNPLLFDFVLKRTLKDPDDANNRFPISMFMYKPALGITREIGYPAAGGK